MVRQFSLYVKYSIYFLPFIILLILKNYMAIDSNLIYIFFLAYIFTLFIIDLYTGTKKNKKTKNQVNSIEEIAKGNLCLQISIGSGTRRNLNKIEDHLTQLIKIFCQNNYDVNMVKEKQKLMLAKYKEIALFFVTDASGQQIYNNSGGNLVNNGNREYFKNAKKTGKAQISDVVISKVTNKLAIVVAVPYFTSNEFRGVFAATIDMQAVSTSEEKLENAILGTMGNLKGLIRSVQSLAEQVADSATTLSSTSQQSADASESVAVSSSEVAKGAEEQLNEILSTTAAIQQMVASIQEILVSAEEISHLSQQANKSALIGKEEVQNAMQSMTNLERSSRQMRLSLDEINKSSAKMDEIVKAIRAIADQTNLLALNASIEAARAGEAGKGFAVVADEIRKLAENSKNSTQEINNLIQEIQYMLVETNRVVNEDSVIVQAGTITVNLTGKALDDIISSVNTVNNQVGIITEAINELAQGSQNIASSTNIIQQKSKDVSDEIQNVSAAAEEQTATIQEIASASQRLTKLSMDLHNTTNHFKV